MLSKIRKLGLLAALFVFEVLNLYMLTIAVDVMFDGSWVSALAASDFPYLDELLFVAPVFFMAANLIWVLSKSWQPWQRYVVPAMALLLNYAFIYGVYEGYLLFIGAGAVASLLNIGGAVRLSKLEEV